MWTTLSRLLGSKASQPKSERFRARPRVEALEDRTVPATAFGLTGTPSLVRFDTASPTVIQATIGITGLTAGDTVRAIDFLPGNTGAFTKDTLFLLTSDTLNTLVRVYTVNTTTGAATLQASSLDATITDGSAGFGFDFNPTNLLLRITDDQGDNVAYNPVTQTFTPNTALSVLPTVAGTPDIVGSAYDRNDTDSLTATTLYGIDFGNNTLNLQGSVDGLPNPPGGVLPNGGIITRVGNLGVTLLTADVGFDIIGSGNGPGVPNTFPGLAGYATFNVGGTTGLYTINLGTGKATLVGNVGTGATPILGLALVTTIPAGTIQTASDIVTFPDQRSTTGDATGDFVPENIIGNGPGPRTRIKIRNAITDALIRTIIPYGVKYRGGVFLAAADLNGDGVLKIITGPGRGVPPLVKIFNAQTGALVGSFLAAPNAPRFRVSGVRVQVADIDGNGRPDIITKVRTGNGTLVNIYNGQTLTLIQSFLI